VVLILARRASRPFCLAIFGQVASRGQFSDRAAAVFAIRRGARQMSGQSGLESTTPQKARRHMRAAVGRLLAFPH